MLCCFSVYGYLLLKNEHNHILLSKLKVFACCHPIEVKRADHRVPNEVQDVYYL